MIQVTNCHEKAIFPERLAHAHGTMTTNNPCEHLHLLSSPLLARILARLLRFKTQWCVCAVLVASASRCLLFSFAISFSVCSRVCFFCASSFFWRSPVEFLFARACIGLSALRLYQSAAQCAPRASLNRLGDGASKSRLNDVVLNRPPLAPRFHMYGRTSTVLLFPSPLLESLRTSAAAAAALLGLLAALPSPNVRGGPPTVRFGAFAFAPVGTEALVAGAGAEPSVRPGPSRPSLDCLPHRLPMNVAKDGIEGWRRR
jgi:hypothetical protein